MRTLVVLCLAILASGCVSLADRPAEVSARKELRSDGGHVIGYEEILRYGDSSHDGTDGGSARLETAKRLTLFVPLVNERGQIIGYEESARGGGTTFRDLEGRKFGGRYRDLRSGKTLTIVVYAAARGRVKVDEVVALVDLKRLDL